MKFSAGALLTVLATANAVSALKNRKVDTAKLLRNAIPVDRNGQPRRLEENDNGYFYPTAYHSVKFNECLSLSAQPQDYDTVFGDDVIAYTKQGQIVSQKSYVLFNVCETQYCSYNSDDDYLFMVDLATYMGAMGDVLPQQKEEYCRACEDAYDVCTYGANYNAEDEAQEDEAQEEDQGEDQAQEDNAEEGDQAADEGDQAADEGDADGGEQRRKLKEAERVLANDVNYVDCYTCKIKGCFDEMDNQNNGDNQNNNGAEEQDMDELVKEWINGMTECQQTGYMLGNQNLYAGFICNADGTGVEPAVFLDEDCSVYTSTKAYKSLVAGTDDYTALYNSYEYVTYPFLNTISCAAQEWESPYSDDNANENQDQDDADGDGILDACEQLFQEGGLNVKDCNVNGQQDEDEQDAQDQDEDAQNYEFYTYILSAQDAQDDQAVCYIIQSLEGEYKEAHTYNDSEEYGSGSVYSYMKAGDGGMNGGKIFGIILLVALVVAGAVLAVQSMSKKKKDSKKTPLVSNKRGAMA